MSSFPIHSFVQSASPQINCIGGTNSYLPLRSLYELRFQFTYTPPPITLTGYRSVFCFPLPEPLVMSGIIPNVLAFPQALKSEMYFISPTEILCNFVRHEAESDFNQWNQLAGDQFKINCNTCFRLVIIDLETTLPDGQGSIISQRVATMTNTFMRVNEMGCEFSDLTYFNAENSHGFIYDTTGLTPLSPSETQFYNAVTLPMWLIKPQYESQLDVYQKTDGSIKKLFEQVTEKWELETDWIHVFYHKCLKIALASDELSIQNFNANILTFGQNDTSFVGGNYSINHDSNNIVLAKGTGELTSKNNIAQRNKYCK